MTDAQYLEAAGWTVEGYMRQGYIQSAQWLDPLNPQHRAVNTSLAVYIQGKRDARAKEQENKA